MCTYINTRHLFRAIPQKPLPPLKEGLVAKGYKVCSMDKTGQLLFSATLAGHRIEYKPHIWVYRPAGCGPLTVFRTLRAARRFVSGKDSAWRWSLTIFACDLIPSQDTEIWQRIGLENLDSNIRPLSHLPAGTRLADAVKLTKRVETYY